MGRGQELAPPRSPHGGRFRVVSEAFAGNKNVPAKWLTEAHEETQALVRQYLPDLELRSGRLFCQGQQSGFYIQQELRDDLLWAAHTAPTGGHFGTRGTLAKLDGNGWWPYVERNVPLLVQTCEFCQRNKVGRAPGRDGALPIAFVNERVHIDFIIMPVPSSNGAA